MPDNQRYISEYLTHLTGSKVESDDERYEVLKTILKDGWITYPPHGAMSKTNREIITYYTKNISANEMYVSSMVCFCDIPISDLGLHVGRYSSFGLAFDKEFIASRGGCPVHYVPNKAPPVWIDMTGVETENGRLVDREVKKCYHLLDDLICANNEWSERAKDAQDFLSSNVFAFMKCFDHTLPDDDPDHYYYEREWRMLKSLKFTMTDVRVVFLSKEYTRRFRGDFPQYYGQVRFL